MSRISLGYYGYHYTFNNEKVFLRSMKEYIVALYLDKEKINYIVEPYDITEKYRPDFFLPDFNTLIEVKDTPAKRLKTLEERQSYFREHGYRLIVLGNYSHFSKLEKRIPNIDYLKQSWIAMDRSNITMNNEINPMYGKKQTEATKNKISAKAKKRCNTKEYKKFLSDRIRNFYQTDKGKELKIKISEMRSAKIVDRNCEICGTVFRIKENKPTRTCSIHCRGKLYSKLVARGDIVMPKQCTEDSKKGSRMRELNRWKRAGFTPEILQSDQDFETFLKTKQAEGYISKRTQITNPTKFLDIFGGEANFFNILKEVENG